MGEYRGYLWLEDKFEVRYRFYLARTLFSIMLDDGDCMISIERYTLGVL